MRKHVRTAATAALVMAALTGGSPASASGAGHGGGNGGFGCFGCGVSSGSLQVQFTGIYNGYVAVLAPSTANVTVFEPAGVTCLVTGSGSGQLVGALNLSLNWTRVGATILGTTSGDVNGVLLAQMVATNVVGNPCGGPLDFALQGVILGT